MEKKLKIKQNFKERKNDMKEGTDYWPGIYVNGDITEDVAESEKK